MRLPLRAFALALGILAVWCCSAQAATVPTVTGVSPNAGPVSGGTIVTVTGTGFIAGATTVDFGLLAATATVTSSTSLTATAPADVGTVDIVVTTAGGTSTTSPADNYTYDPLPTVTGVSPAVGPAAGGTSVTITGTGFIAGATAVSFGTGRAASTVTVNSSTSITATSPTTSAGTVDVVVTTPGGTSVTGAADKFTFDPRPAVTNIAPSAGPLNGGTSVTIAGSGFIAGASTVTFGATNAAAVTVTSPTSITATAPAESAGTVDVIVTTPGGASATGTADQYTYEPVPTVTSIAPTAGPLGGGTQVTITGTGFVVGGTTVMFGTGRAVNITVTSPTSITASPPAEAAGTIDVKVTTAGGTSYTSPADQFTFDAAPTVTAVAANAGPTSGGTTVTITGTNFVAGASTVAFGTQLVPSVTVSSTTVTATTPAGTAGAVDVTVITPGGTSAITAADRFTYDPPPTVTAITPAEAPLGGGTSVAITGTNFIAGATTVAFGSGHAATRVVINSPTSITATSPAGAAGTVDVTVTTPGGTSATSSADQFSYDPVPAVTGVAPSAGPTGGGTVVVISGTGFVAGSTTVAFSTGHAATNAMVSSATSLTAIAPAGAAATVDVIVTTPGGTSATGTADKFTYVSAPTVTGVSPAVGSATGGTSVTITGTNFTAGAAVAFGSNVATNVTVKSATSIIATAPPSAAGAIDVTVTTPGGLSATSSADRFTYDPLPTVAAASPTAGPLSAGTVVTLTGSGFISGATTVTFGAGHAGTGVTVTSPTSLTVTAPAESPGTVDITVTTPGGTSPTSSADVFSYDPPPTVAAVSPGAGPTGGGATVTITGTGFVVGLTSVAFGAAHAATNVSVVSPTTLTATSPAEPAGTFDITISTPGGTSATVTADKYAADPVPTVTAVSPGGGPVTGGTTVTITGTNFIAGATSVAFGTRPAAPVTVKSTTSITAPAPAGSPGSVDITVTTPGGTSPTSSADAFGYDPIPTVAAIAPDAGPIAGGTTVTVTGTGFVPGATTVAVGTGHAAANVVVTSSTSLAATAPAEAAGTVHLQVTTPGGTSATGAGDRFSFDPIPTITSVAPTNGPAFGGTAVSITGTGFVPGATTVAFGSGHAAATTTVNSATSITATSPVEPPGGVDMTITTPGGTSTTTSADRFTFNPPPSVTAVSPGIAPLNGTTPVTVTGTGFISGATSVAFGGHAASKVTVSSATSLTAVAPAASAGTVDITVTTGNGTSSRGATDLFIYAPVPSVSAIRPGAGPVTGGTRVAIAGSGFIPGATSVSFGAGHPAASVAVNSSTSIAAAAPAGSEGTVDITVTSPGGTSYIGPSDKFTYAGVPTVSAVSPRHGSTAGGTVVTITGTRFIAGATTIEFGTRRASRVSVSATSITATSPAGATGTIDITVVTPAGTSATGRADKFEYKPAPTITSLRPDAGPDSGGTKVTVNGSNLAGATAVTFGGKPATSFKVVSDNEITAVTPPRSAGSVHLTVTSPTGPSGAANASTFTYAIAPTATSRPAAAVTATTAVLRGTARPNGLPAITCQFEYGRSPRYGHVIACARPVGANKAPVAVSVTLAQLAPGSNYHFRLRIRTLAGTSVGPDEQFTTRGQSAAGGTASHLALIVQSVTNRRGIIGRLTGITGVAGTSGETATIACLRGCTSQAIRRIAVGSHSHAGGRLTLSPPILLSPATQIQVRLTATGRPTWSARYAFSQVGSKLRVRRI